MYSGKHFLAIIPARGGSKALPLKNIRLLAGRPLLAYTIDQAKAVSDIDLTVVSTDHAEIRKIAVEMGVNVVERPHVLAVDDCPTELALLHALDTLAEEGTPTPDYVIVLEPTSPFRSAQTIRNCMGKIITERAPSLLTVRESKENVGTLVNGVFCPIRPGAPRRRQEREAFFIESSTVYICEVDHLRTTHSLVANNWAAYVIPDTEAIDINTLEDFRLAECLINARQEIK